MADLAMAPVDFEVLGDGYAPDGGQFGTGEQSMTMSLKVAYDDEAEMIKYLLGYSKKVVTTPAVIGPPFVPEVSRLSRVPPVHHPRYPRFWATKVATKPYGPSWAAADGVVQPPLPRAGLVDGPYGPYPAYKFSQLTVSFSTVPFRTLTDDQLQAKYLGTESYRYVQELSTTAIEILQLKQGYLRFFRGAGADAFPGIGNENLPTVKPTVRYPARTLTWRWFDVPANFLLSAGGSTTTAGVPTKLDYCNVKVNSVPFHGYPAGTLLCLTPKYTPRDAPVDAATMGLDPDDPAAPLHTPARYYDVELTFAFLDPPRPLNYSFRGHNLAIAQTAGGEKLFYLLVDQSAPLGDSNPRYRLYKEASFELLFTSADSST